jgi:UDP-glucose 4-epimerase
MVPGALLTEDTTPEPRHPYAIARLTSEHQLASSVPQPVIFRLTNSVGAPVSPAVDRWSLVANDLCRQGATTGRLELRTSGTQWRDFVSLTDVCTILAAAAGVTSKATEPLPSGTYNLGSGRSWTVRQLARLVQDGLEAATGHRPPLTAPDAEPDPPGPYAVSTDRLDRTGWKVTTPLERAVEETLMFCLNRLSRPRGNRAAATRRDPKPEED